MDRVKHTEVTLVPPEHSNAAPRLRIMVFQAECANAADAIQVISSVFDKFRAPALPQAERPAAVAAAKPNMVSAAPVHPSGAQVPPAGQPPATAPATKPAASSVPSERKECGPRGRLTVRQAILQVLPGAGNMTADEIDKKIAGLIAPSKTTTGTILAICEALVSEAKISSPSHGVYWKEA